jgi:hypothetical protein
MIALGPGRAPRPRPPRVDWWSPASLRLHAALVVGVTVSLAAGWLELGRARHGHVIAWAYTVEWPLFAVMGTYLWWRLLHGDATPPRLRRRPKTSKNSVDPLDPGLIAWHAYLDRLHATDPPGGPPGAQDPRVS